MWRVKGQKNNSRKHLTEVGRYWRELDCGVDAAYQRPSDQRLVFFKGTNLSCEMKSIFLMMVYRTDGDYYEYRGLTIESGYPRPVSELGLPAFTKIDDVVYMKWGKKNRRSDIANDRTYYFVGDKVYRYDVIFVVIDLVSMLMRHLPLEHTTQIAWSGVIKLLKQ